MSILVIQVLSKGIIFGADRNITYTEKQTINNKNEKVVFIKEAQSQRPKVLMWPNKKALFGYVGAATIAGLSTDEWFYSFIGENLLFESLKHLSKKLCAEVEKQRKIDEAENDAQPLIIHLAGYEKQDDYYVPFVWFIRNAYQLDSNGYSDFRKEYLCTEEFWKYFPDTQPKDIKNRLIEKENNFKPFWFHQGFDLGTFNTLEAFLHEAFKWLSQNHPKHKFPTSLLEWEQNLKMSILTYESYFQSFNKINEQYVGGGVDTVKLFWP